MSTSTVYYTIPNFNDPGTFENTVFYPIKDSNHHISNIEFVDCKCFLFGQRKNFVVWYRIKLMGSSGLEQISKLSK